MPKHGIDLHFGFLQLEGAELEDWRMDKGYIWFKMDFDFMPDLSGRCAFGLVLGTDFLKFFTHFPDTIRKFLLLDLLNLR